MLKIRLSRIGKTVQPSFRVVLQERTAAVKGKFIEALGHYRPAITPKELKLDVDRIKYWLSVGAQPSDSIAVLLKAQGVEGMEKYIEPRNKKRKSKKAQEGGEQGVSAPAPSAKVEATPEPKAETPTEVSTPETPAPDAPAEIPQPEAATQTPAA